MIEAMICSPLMGSLSLISIPMELKDGKSKYSQCKMYDRNYTDILAILHKISPEKALNTSTKQFFEETDFSPSNFEIIDCKNGWIYDRQMFPNTVVMEVREFYLFCSEHK